MDISFYTAGVAARAQQDKLNVIGNNMANANTTAYKSQTAGFVDLLYSNMRDPAETDTQLKVGSGVRMEKTDINYTNGGPQATDNPTDYTIAGSGFFAIQDPGTNEIFYTRDGSFKKSLFQDGEFYLTTANGELVLDDKMERIKLDMPGDVEEKPTTPGTNAGTTAAAGAATEEKEVQKPGVFDFQIRDGLLLVGNNRFTPTAKNGQPILQEDAQLQTGYLEMSNTEVSDEMVKLIETQRVYSMTLKMVQTSNEVEEVINNLR